MILRIVVACSMLLGTLGLAHAGLAVDQWFYGKWDCLLDGRAAEMEWRTKEVQNTVCSSPDVCSTSSSFETVGSFKDGSGPWVPLKYLQSNNTTLDMRHPDGNAWHLAKVGKRAEGWTTWNGNRYPLSCARKGSGRVRRGPVHP